MVLTSVDQSKNLPDYVLTEIVPWDNPNNPRIGLRADYACSVPAESEEWALALDPT